MIPNYQECMRPLLEVVSAHPASEIKIRDARNQIAENLGLTEDEIKELLPSGRQTILDNRIGWAKTYLLKAGLLDSSRRGYVSITQRGLDALQNSPLINKHFLQQFPEFIQFTDGSAEPCASEEDPQALNETPDETLMAAYKTIQNALALDILERTRKVTPEFFEHLLIDLLLAMGYGGTGEGKAIALGKSGDNGVDGVIDQDPLGVDQIYIQAKRYAEGNNISVEQIRGFSGALDDMRARKGIFITTSDFTKPARKTAENSSFQMVLINGDELARLMLRYNIGCRDEQVLHLKKIDEEFFES